jgi:hypothetical protein
MRSFARIFVLGLLCGGVLFAQEQQPAPAAPPVMAPTKPMRRQMRQHMQQMYQQLHAKQIPEMAKMEKTFAGRWRVAVKYEPSPEMGMPTGGSAQGMAMIHSGPAGNSLMEMVRTRSAQGPFQGVMVLWRDPKADSKDPLDLGTVKKPSGMYRRVWCDSDAPTCDASGTGNWEGDNLVFTSAGEYGGQKYQTKETFIDIKPDSFTFQLDMAIGDQPLKRVMTITYTKVGEAGPMGAPPAPKK